MLRFWPRGECLPIRRDHTRSACPDHLNMCSSRAKVEAGAPHDGVAVATAGVAGAAAVAGTAVVEVATAVPVVLAVIQVDPKGTVEATTAPEGPREIGVYHEGKRCIVRRCARCSGVGHQESACPSDATILVLKLPDDDSEENMFAANATGKCSLRICEEVGDEELDTRVAQYIADSGATCHLTPDADGSTNHRECSRPLVLADRRKISIAGYGDLTVAFRSNDSWAHVKLHDVVRVPLLSYNLVSITSLAQEGHSSALEASGVTLKLEEGGTVQFPLIEKLCRQYGYRSEVTGRMVDTACAVIAPGQAKTPPPPD